MTQLYVIFLSVLAVNAGCKTKYKSHMKNSKIYSIPLLVFTAKLPCVLLFLALIVPNLVVKAQESGKIRTVVLDAGHGGEDPGNPGTGKFKFTEKHVALDVTLKLGAYIEQYFPDVKVVYTRKTDVFIPLDKRADIANKAQADLFISIHCNSFQKSAVFGTETWVMGLHKSEENLKVAQNENAAIFYEDNYEEKYEGFDPTSPESMIALTMRQNVFLEQSLLLSAEIQNQFRERVSRHDRGVKQAGFVVISRTTMPSVLVELGFLTNPKEERFLLSEKGQDYMASAIFRAFRSYKEKIEGLNSQVVIENNNESITKNDVQFKVQFLSSRQKVALNQLKFEDTALVDYYETNGWIKYTYGQTVDYKEAKDLLKEAKKAGYSEAFVVAFKNGERIPVKDAVAELKNRN